MREDDIKKRIRSYLKEIGIEADISINKQKTIIIKMSTGKIVRINAFKWLFGFHKYDLKRILEK